MEKSCKLTIAYTVDSVSFRFDTQNRPNVFELLGMLHHGIDHVKEHIKTRNTPTKKNKKKK